MSDPRFDELVQWTEGEVTTRRAAELERELASSEPLRAEKAKVDALMESLSRPAPGLDAIDLRPDLWANVEATPAPRARRLPLWLSLAAGLMVMATLSFLALRGDGIREKGGQGSLTGFEAFVVRGDEVTPLGATMHVGDALGFSYRNLPGSRATELLLYGVDSRGETFWFYPAWTDASRPPDSLHIGTSNEPVRLMEAVRHALVPGRLELHAVFLTSPVSVSDAEAGRLPEHEASTLTVEVLP
ncbi:MAG: hypothetical protein GQE15_38870 [Archangiaceae bacterium]|nr:hypothetical protein [Archangiaceae bacterium]